MKKLIIALLLLAFSTVCLAGSGAIKAVIARKNAGNPDACVGGEKIGYDTVGGSTGYKADENGTVMGIFTASCTGGLASAFVYATVTDNGTLAVFNAVSGVPPDSGDTFVGESATITSTETDGWFSNTFPSGSVVKNQTYYLVFYSGNFDWTLNYNADAGSAYFTDSDTTCNGFDDADYSEITNAGGCDFPTDDGRIYSMYVTLKAP